MSTSLSALAVLALTLGNGGAALAVAPPSLNIENKARLADVVHITVVVDANCGAGATSGDVTVNVSQRTGADGFSATGSGIGHFTSDGTKQQIPVTVVGGLFQLGAAVASAQLDCLGVLTAEVLGVNITIQ